MLEKKAKNREQVEFICLENIVLQDHLLRKIDNAVDFDKLYEFKSCTATTTADQV